MEIINFIMFYAWVALGVLLINSFIAGFTGAEITRNDVSQSLTWPVSIAMLLGLTIRVGINAYKEAQQKPTPQKKKENK